MSLSEGDLDWWVTEEDLRDEENQSIRDTLRTFASGATRDTDDGKLDYEAFLSPLVLQRFAEYMHHHRTQGGELRDGDNWQKGMPKDEYMKSAWRHFMDVQLCHDGYEDKARGDLEEALCALLFNVQGYLHELLKGT